LLIAGRYCLDVADFNDLQDLELEDFEKQAGKQVKCFFTMLNLWSFSL
jgi:hypothetical protein